ncbi:MAG: hypothetical protein JNM27_13460 [Leptospirales bacterium]|nr:hypothetical protein [Leptospirales bacterium]
MVAGGVFLLLVFVGIGILASLDGLEESELYAFLLALSILVPLYLALSFYLKPWETREFHLSGRRFWERGENWTLDLGRVTAVQIEAGLSLRQDDSFTVLVPRGLERFGEFHEAVMDVIRNSDSFPKPSVSGGADALALVYVRVENHRAQMLLVERNPFEKVSLGLGLFCFWIVLMIGSVAGFEMARGRQPPANRAVHVFRPFLLIGLASVLVSATFRLLRKRHFFMQDRRYAVGWGPLRTSPRDVTGLRVQPVRQLTVKGHHAIPFVDRGVQVLLQTNSGFCKVSPFIAEPWIALSILQYLAQQTGIPELPAQRKKKDSLVLDPLIPIVLLYAALIGIAGRFGFL